MGWHQGLTAQSDQKEAEAHSTTPAKHLAGVQEPRSGGIWGQATPQLASGKEMGTHKKEAGWELTSLKPVAEPCPVLLFLVTPATLSI